ncbi:hypothetical protein D0Z07_7547 [Hyphodiscus hymeniophilus]|uniref:Uncharacterized protein n=1 Tax=Hyphodiscus hymeniophilus TaxID=353542 RepID=A0A9P6VET7_9HELO|nr:hypothetical protein D0Z07_7547 [Hyphodiscus hymeniophilus]
MANYQQYPTPPRTSSPKHSANYQSEQAYDHNYPEPSPFTQPQRFSPQSQPSLPPKLSAQDSYFHSYSAPGSPVHEANASQRPPRPIRRRSSPLLAGPGGVQYPSSRPWTPTRPYSPSSLNRLSPRPLHFSPANPVPSPYSAGRPKPRPGFLRRMAMKVEAWIKGFMRWSKKNPMLAGVLTFIPVMTIAGVVKIARGLGKGLGFIEKGVGRPPRSGKGEKGVGGEGEWGWGLDEFKSFGGSKGGPLDGVMKIAQMLW